MKNHKLYAAAIAFLLLTGCAGGTAETSAVPASTSANTTPASQAPESIAGEAEPEENESEPEAALDIPVYEMEYELPEEWQSAYDYGDRTFSLHVLPNTDAEAAVCLYWQAEQSGEFIRHSYLWADGTESYWQIMINNAYTQREEENAGFVRIEVLALQELTREQTLTAQNTVYDEPLLQRYFEAFGQGTIYSDYVAALYDGGFRVVYLKLDTEYLPETVALGPQYDDGEREICYLVGPDADGNPVLYANSYGYSILIPNPGDESPAGATSTAP